MMLDRCFWLGANNEKQKETMLITTKVYDSRSSVQPKIKIEICLY